jgi:hypothetical protein
VRQRLVLVAVDGSRLPCDFRCPTRQDPRLASEERAPRLPGKPNEGLYWSNRARSVAIIFSGNGRITISPLRISRLPIDATRERICF